MDCAAVLEELKDLSPIPHKYRICKELKSRATKEFTCKDLWEQVLKKGKSEQRIDQFDFDLLPNPKKTKETISMRSNKPIDFQKSDVVPINSAVASRSDVQLEFIKCQNSIRALADLGYELTPLIHGKWGKSSITKWRIVPTQDISEKGVFDSLHIVDASKSEAAVDHMAVLDKRYNGIKFPIGLTDLLNQSEREY